jgi:hypothetical protein
VFSATVVVYGPAVSSVYGARTVFVFPKLQSEVAWLPRLPPRVAPGVLLGVLLGAASSKRPGIISYGKFIGNVFEYSPVPARDFRRLCVGLGGPGTCAFDTGWQVKRMDSFEHVFMS